MNLSKTFLFSTILAATVATAGVIDDAKFKLDLRGDPNNNAYIDAGEVGNAFDYSAASPDSVIYGGGNGQSSISASQYISNGYAKYGTLPYVSSVSVVNPYDGSAATRPALVLPQSTKVENGTTYYAINGIALPNSAVPPGTDGYLTIYARFKWDGNSADAKLLVGNGWDGAYGSTDNGISVYLSDVGFVGIVNNKGMGASNVQVPANVWCDLFVVAHNETVSGAEKCVSQIYLYKARSGTAPTLATGSRTGNPMVFSSSKKRLTIGSYRTMTGWQTGDARALQGSVSDVMIWDRAITSAEMAAVMASRGGEWQIGALNNSADEFGDTDPAAVYDVQTMPWSQMRKTLDASNPTLSIAATMTSSEHQMARTLSFTPILSGATAPVAVALNGTAVGEIDLASTTSITLPKELWRHDGTANTITVTRTAAASGTIQFDAISLAPAPTATSVLDDASFKLDLRGGASTYTKPGDLGNALTFSSASPIVGYMGDQRGPQTYNANYGNLPAQETAAVTNPYYPYTTNTQNVLHFYQDSKSATQTVRSSVVLPGAAPQGPVQTFYVRFRWDGGTPTDPSYIFQSGNAVNGYQTTGVALYIHQDSVSEDMTTTNAILGVRGSKTDGFLDVNYIKPGEWCDIFVTFTQNAANTAFTVASTLCKPSPTDNQFNPPSLLNKTRTFAKALSFDTANLTIGGYHESSDSASPTRCFRGLIADFMVWDRALSDDEKIEVMAGQHGAKWRVGAINGSADEFNDTNPAAIYEPQTMPWRQMRKTLDASNPSLTLKSPLATYEAGKPMILHVDPIFTGTGASVPVSVAVNGTASGSFDLAQKRNFIIEKRFWQRDGNGNVTVTLTRTETTGAVAIDALSLSGSWQIQGDMLDQQNAANHYFAGDPAAKHAGSSFSVGANHKVYNFGVWVPAGMSELCGWKFHSKASTMHQSVLPENRTFTLSVNGTVKETVNGVAKGGTYSIALPEGALRDGMNMVEFRQTVPASGTEWSFYDHWGMNLVPPANPFVLTFR